MPIGRDFAFDVGVVEQHELFRELVVVRCNRFGEQAQAAFAVALWEVAEDLIVGAIFLDDVDDVLDRRSVAELAWDRVIGGHIDRVRGVVFLQRAAFVGGLRVLRHQRGRRYRQHRDRTFKQRADVFERAFRVDGVRAVVVRLRR